MINVSGSKIINNGCVSSNEKSRISDADPNPGNHSITDSDPTFELQIDKKRHQHFGIFWT